MVDCAPFPTGDELEVSVLVVGIGTGAASREPVGPGSEIGDGLGPGEGLGLGVGLGDGFALGLGDGLGSGDGLGLGDGAGDGVGCGAGAAVTMAVGCDCASSEPCSFVTRTRTRSTKPTSSPITMRWLEVAPGMTEQPPFALAHRSHCQSTVGSGSPVQLAVAVNVRPTCDSPEITGWVTVGGPGAARPRAGTVSAATGNASTNEATTTRERIRARIPTMRPILAGSGTEVDGRS